jgi:endonuclease YncB( thermonuclease family)
VRSLLVLAVLLFGCAPVAVPREREQAGPSGELVPVSFVIDGDTVETSEGRVRLLGIDAPEFGECFFEEAKAELRRLVGRQSVTLVADPDQEDRDKYDRLLRYVEIGGTDVGAELLENGFARLFPWFPFERLGTYRNLASEAREEKKGLWGACP